MLAEMEEDASGAPGAFVDVGSGRGQIPVLAAALRPWSRCAGLGTCPCCTPSPSRRRLVSELAASERLYLTSLKPRSV